MGSTDVDVVLFDLDDTICRHRRSVEELLADAFESAGVEPFFTADDFRRWIPKVVADDPLDLRRQCFAGIAEENGQDPDLGYRVADAYDDPDPSNVEFLPGAKAAVEAITDRYRTGLVTNGWQAIQERKLEALGIADAFDATVFGTPEEALKPDPDPFYWALDALDASSECAVHVGNSLESDVAGAQAAGVGAVWLAADATRQFDANAPDYAIGSMGELLPPPWEE